MRVLFPGLLVVLLNLSGFSQPASYSASQIQLMLKKLKVLGSVLYVAAHPDDENNTLLPYLAKDKMYRTAYLSLTRGDGGQNLIGDEQGLDLGLIRTQELLAARRIDGAEQYFTRAYEFGYSKNPNEALRIWDREKVLSDMVWVIRKFQPDVIIKRFPTDARGGHGHHTASAILADEAYVAAADAKRFPEQLKDGLKPWQAKRLLWNTYNFGSNNTTSADQFKIDVGNYNPYLGKSYGEIGAEARTMHKSQGEGRPRRRGTLYEFFSTTAGQPPVNSLFDGIDTTWARLEHTKRQTLIIDSIIKGYDPERPQAIVPSLLHLYQAIIVMPASVWRDSKLKETLDLIDACSGMFSEIIAQRQLQVPGDSNKYTLVFNNRLGVPVNNVEFNLFGEKIAFGETSPNELSLRQVTIKLPTRAVSQPYWLEAYPDAGNYQIQNASLIGLSESPQIAGTISFSLFKQKIIFERQILYKYTDPVKGEIYQPVQIVHPVHVSNNPSIIIFKNEDDSAKKFVQSTLQANTNIRGGNFTTLIAGKINFSDTVSALREGQARNFFTTVSSDAVSPNSSKTLFAEFTAAEFSEKQTEALQKISYDHIPDIFYHYRDEVKLLKMDLKTKGSRIGYFEGAGDKIPEALEAMGYRVDYLSEANLHPSQLKLYDAIVTGIRAYNLHEYLSDKNDVLMEYVKNGGNLIVQYLRSNATTTQKKIQAGPFPFSIDASSRVTEEDAAVQFSQPGHPVLNVPNKITEADFKGWIQERSTYQAVEADTAYQMPLTMNDANEKPSSGSLLIAEYGKGNFVYSSLVFFRQLPAAVPGAYRLFANLIALPKR